MGTSMAVAELNMTVRIRKQLPREDQRNNSQDQYIQYI